MKFLTLLLAIIMSGSVMAKTPSYKEARAIYDQLGVPVSATGLWHTKPLPERLAALREAEAFVAKTEKVFGGGQVGDSAACRSAAIARKFYVIQMNDLALIMEGRRNATPSDVFSPMFNSVSFGEHKAFCYHYVESLDQKR